MKLGAIIQARMSSERLPGKVLMPLNGRPVLAYVLERLQRARGLDEIVVATSSQRSDDPVADFCSQREVSVFRGGLEDVAGRFAGAAEQYGFDAFVRVSGDSPLLDQHLVERGVQLFRDGEAEIVSNVFPRRCPVGESVEVVSLAALRRALPAMGAKHREHVTLAFYEQPEHFSIVGFALGDKDSSGISLAVDSPADAELVATILERMERPHWDYDLQDLLELRERVTGGEG